MDETQDQHEPVILIPFAGRQQAVDRLSQHLVDPARLGAVGFSGRRYSGKTRLLQHFQQTAPATDLMVMVDCAAPWLNDEQFIRGIGQRCTDVVVEQGYVASGTNQLPNSETISRDWFGLEYLPALYRAIRATRKLVLLLDNAHTLIDQMDEGVLADDLGKYLRSLIGPQLGLVFTLDVDYEDRVDSLKLLTPPNQLHRLMNLTDSDIRYMMQGVLSGRMTDEAVNLVFQNSGGEPAIAYQMALRLYETGHNVDEINSPQVQAIIPTLLNDLDAEFHAVWQPLSMDSKQILVAIATLNYEHPMTAITSNSIENWLIRTDFPLEDVEIGATLRGLEYREIITIGTGSAVSFTSRLFQRWVLRQADQQTPITLSRKSYQNSDSAPISSVVWFAIAITAALVILAIALSSNVLDEDTSETIVPTVTLVSDQ